MPFLPTTAAAPAGGFGQLGTPVFNVYPGPAAANGAGEPSIGVNWNTGNIFFQAWSTTLRVIADDTKSPPTLQWQDVSAPYSIYNVDPILFTDHVSGRTFAGGLAGECSILAYTDNDGQSWTPMSNSCASPSFDHETVGSGPWADPAPQEAVFPRAVYYCAQTSVAQCAVSHNGGLSFGPAVPVQCGTVNPGLHGSIHVGPNGYAWLPFKRCGGSVGVSLSRDNGLTWETRKIPGTTSPADGFDPDVATTPGGWTYVGYMDADRQPYVALTKDNGANWQKWNVGASLGIKQSTFHEMVAGDDNRAAIAFLGSTASGNGFSTSFTGTWDLYVAMTYDAGATWETIKVTTDPVQRGLVCDDGFGVGACPQAGRNMLDFMDAQVDKHGRVVVGFADGCINACAGPSGTKAQSTADWGTIARQSTGRGLFAAYDQVGPQPLSVATSGPYTGVLGGAVGVGATATGGTAPYAFSWSVTSAPSGSSATFANPNAAATTFTPDVAGAYTLRVDVADAALGAAFATTTLTATIPTPGGCQTGGVLVATDATDDTSGNGGDAAEGICLRMSDDAQLLKFELDLKGTSYTTPFDNWLYWDFHFTADYAASTRFAISVSHDGSELSATYVEPDTFVPIPGKTVTAEFVGDTLRVTTPRSEILSPANGDTLSAVGVDINFCDGETTCGTLVHADYVPNAMNGQYTLGGSSGSGGGLPIPRCSHELATDAAADTTATGAGKDRRDAVRFGTSDTVDTWTFCFDVVNFDDRPSGTGATSDTRFSVSWDAPYEAPGISYSARAVFAPDGTMKSASMLKGIAGSTSGALGGTIFAEREGNQVRIVVAKAQAGAPADGEQAVGLFGRISDDGTGNGAQFDRVPNSGTREFTFGQKLSDSTPPSQVVGLSVADPQTGSSLTLTWTAATDDTGVTSYEIRRGTTAGGPYATIATPAGTAFSDTGLTSGTTYYYVVAAKDAAGNVGAASAEASGSPTPPPPDVTPPTVPTGLIVSGTETDRISISWTASADPESGVAGYKVWRDGAFLAQVQTLAYTDEGLEIETEYLYEVAALNGAGLESAKASISATTLPLPPPDCGQRAYEFLTDPDFDSGNDERRSDIVRVSANEDSLVWFHVGMRNLSGPQSATRVVVWVQHAEVYYRGQATVTDAGVTGGAFQPIAFVDDGNWASTGAGWTMQVRRECDSILFGINPAPLNAQEGSVFTKVWFETTSNTNTNAQQYDRAPTSDAAMYTLGDANLPPVMPEIGDKTVSEGSLLSFTVLASDPNGDALTFRAAGLPSGATFNAATQEFRWTPSATQAGVHRGVVFYASDGKFEVERSIDITVTDVDVAPVVHAIAPAQVIEGASKTTTVTASDPDGDAVSISVDGLPSWASFVDGGAGSGTITWAPPLGVTGSFTAQVTATANGLTSAPRDASVTVFPKVGVSLTRDGAQTVLSSPGRTMTVTATLVNTGASTDTFTFKVNAPAGWAIPVPGAVTLGAGQSETVTLQVSVPNTGKSTISLTATSTANTAVKSTTSWVMDSTVATVLSAIVDKAGGVVRGTVTATFADGSPVANRAVELTQTPTTFGAAFSSSVTVTTGADGKADYEFSDFGATLPDKHQLVVRVITDKASTFYYSYTVPL